MLRGTVRPKAAGWEAAKKFFPSVDVLGWSAGSSFCSLGLMSLVPVPILSNMAPSLFVAQREAEFRSLIMTLFSETISR